MLVNTLNATEDIDDDEDDDDDDDEDWLFEGFHGTNCAELPLAIRLPLLFWLLLALPRTLEGGK